MDASERMGVRALFVNSGFLGHASVLALIRAAVEAEPSIAASFIDLSRDLTRGERALRKIFSLRLWRDGWLDLANADLFVYRSERFHGLLAARRIAAIERRSGASDVIHFHTQAAAWGSIARMRRVPSIVSIDRTQQSLMAGCRSALEASTLAPNGRRDGRVFRAARAIVAPSRWAGDELARAYPDCAEKLRVIRYPTRRDAIDASWIDERRARADRSGYLPTVLFVGADFPRKGGPELVSAWRESRLRERARLELVTRWPIDEPDPSEGIRVIRGVEPRSSEWLRAWREADVFVLPTRDDAFGMVVQEAAAAGLPVVASRLSAMPELVDDGRTGILIDVGDRAALVRALDRLIASADLRRDMGRAAREHIVRVAPPDNYARALLSLVRETALARVR